MVYHYTGRGLLGDKVSGQMESDNREEAISTLLRRSITVTQMSEKPTSAGGFSLPNFFGGISLTEQVVFFRSLAMMCQKNVQIRTSLQICIDRSQDKNMKEALMSLLTDVEDGVRLSDAMERRPKEFNQLQIALVQAGEQSGQMGNVLNRLATFLERDRGMGSKIKSALAYPAVIMMFAGVLVYFMMTKIVPMFIEMFDQFHAELPVFTLVVIALSKYASSPIFYITFPLIVLGIFIAVRYALSRDDGMRAFESIRLKIPIVGAIYSKSTTARVARIYATLTSSGISTIDSLDIVSGVAGGVLYKTAIQDVRLKVIEGEKVSVAFTSTNVFDPLFTGMLTVAEKTGDPEDLLNNVASFFEDEVENTINALASIIEPVLMVFVGVVVGALVLSIFIPLYSLVNQIN